MHRRLQPNPPQGPCTVAAKVAPNLSTGPHLYSRTAFLLHLPRSCFTHVLFLLHSALQACRHRSLDPCGVCPFLAVPGMRGPSALPVPSVSLGHAPCALGIAQRCPLLSPGCSVGMRPPRPLTFPSSCCAPCILRPPSVPTTPPGPSPVLPCLQLQTQMFPAHPKASLPHYHLSHWLLQLSKWAGQNPWGDS